MMMSGQRDNDLLCKVDFKIFHLLKLVYISGACIQYTLKFIPVEC